MDLITVFSESEEYAEFPVRHNEDEINKYFYTIFFREIPVLFICLQGDSAGHEISRNRRIQLASTESCSHFERVSDRL